MYKTLWNSINKQVKDSHASAAVLALRDILRAVVENCEEDSGCFTYGLDNDRSSGRIFNLHNRRYVLCYKGNCCPLQWRIYRTDFGVLWRHFISVQIRIPPFD